tara:strand:- start:46 stop:456 length:411 start_codon:yes stop_codon:yes gene_type:complete
MNESPMPISQLMHELAFNAAKTLAPKENKTVIELPDLQEMIGLLGNFRPEGNAVMQPQVNDMPSYDMMLADNSNANPYQEIDDRLIESGNQYIDPYADAPGPTEPTNEEHKQMLIDMEYNNSPEGYNERINELRGY